MLKIGVCARGGRGTPDIKGVEVFEVRPSGKRLPSQKVCQRWRREAHEDLEFIVQIPQEVHSPGSESSRRFLEPLQKVERGWKEVLETASVLEAETFVFSLPVQVNPTEQNKEKLAGFLKETVGASARVVVEPSGLWSQEDLLQLEEGDHVVVASQTPPPPEEWGAREWAFLRYTGLGRSRLGGDLLYTLAEFCLGPWEGICLIDVPQQVQDFSRLRKAMEELD